MSSGLRLGVALFLALALLTSLSAAPAAAKERPSDDQYEKRDNDNDNNNHHKKNTNNNRHKNNGGGGGGGGAFEISQESEQDAESGDLNQSFNVSQTGDNSNQCVGIQGVGNTGDAQNLFDLTQVNAEADDVDAEDVGSTIDDSPANTTTCDQQVNQAASAAAEPPPFCTWWVDSLGRDVCTWSADGTNWTVD